MAIQQRPARAIFSRFKNSLNQVPKDPTPEHVHHLRTSARRLETFLETFGNADDPVEQKLLKAAAKARRRAGRVRDLDVQKDALKSLNIEHEQGHKQRVLDGLAAKRDKQSDKLVNALGNAKLARIRKRLRRVTERYHTDGNTGSRGAHAAPWNEAEPVTLALERFAAPDFVRLTPENLHPFRLHCKRCRYIAELGANNEAKHLVSELKRVQDTIGEWHDLMELTGTAQKILAPVSRCALLSALHNITEAKLQEALRLATDVRQNLLAMTAERLATATAKPPAPERPKRAAQTA